MSKRILSAALAALLVNTFAAVPARAATEAEKQVKFTGKVRAAVLRLGVGEAARVKVTLRDKTKLEGYVSAASDDSFVVTDAKTRAATTVAYPQVRSVKGNNLSKGTKIAIGVGVAAAIIFLIVFHEVVTEDE